MELPSCSLPTQGFVLAGLEGEANPSSGSLSPSLERTSGADIREGKSVPSLVVSDLKLKWSGGARNRWVLTSGRQASSFCSGSSELLLSCE